MTAPETIDWSAWLTRATGNVPQWEDNQMAKAEPTALEAVRELHVLYGIAATSELTETEPAIYSVYGKMIWGIHWAILAITAGDDAATELGRLVNNWNHLADESDDERVTALYGTWAQNIKSIT